ncbi:unnamed protein product, partial [Durusdinium trenchii]
ADRHLRQLPLGACRGRLFVLAEFQDQLYHEQPHHGGARAEECPRATHHDAPPRLAEPGKDAT